MWGLSEWMSAADVVSRQILDRAEYAGEAVDAAVLTRRLGFDIVYDRQQASRGRLKQFGRRRSIFIKPDQRSERIHWAICHELGECFAHHVFQYVGAQPDESSPGMREQVANFLAARLLLPGQTFFEKAHDCRESLPVLKTCFHTASHELIALRLLDQEASRCLTIVDQGRITKRRANHFACERSFLPIEQICWQTSHEQCRDLERTDEDLRIHCWAIHEPHWKREIVMTMPVNEYQSDRKAEIHSLESST
ncbi:MAG TPA: hypothetical protein DD473_07280 [Planctomycetaceae bacterium]|nr:hypothetical protein [Planctomycetaceae bacterium]